MSCQNALTVLKDIQPAEDELELALEPHRRNKKQQENAEEDEVYGLSDMEGDTAGEQSDEDQCGEDNSAKKEATLSTYMKVG